jgi:acyl-CoA dehydrogenase
MNRAWPREAIEVEAVVAEALASLGGVDLARKTEADPALRTTTLAPTLAELGVEELDPTGDPLQAMLAARAVRAAGAVICPWPLVQVLSVPAALRDVVGAVYVGDGAVRRLEHLDVVAEPAVCFLRTGASVRARQAGPIKRMPLDPFGVSVTLGEELEADLRRAALTNLLLSSFWILGAMSYIVDLSAAYAARRKQFGRAIVEFGAIQWRLADSAVARDSLEELAAYTLWLDTTRQATTADYLALRLAALDGASIILTHAHQIFASIGLCEEHDLAVIDRHLQPFVRRPFGAAGTARLLAGEIRAGGFDALFPIVVGAGVAGEEILASATDG